MSALEGTVDARLHEVQPAQVPARPQPTRRQREYLEFIQKYMARHGCALSESDIQDHFMVSARIHRAAAPESGATRKPRTGAARTPALRQLEQPPSSCDPPQFSTGTVYAPHVILPTRR